MQILGYESIYEKGIGWGHQVTFKTDSGAIVSIEDDTETVNAYSDTPDAITPAELGKLWSEWAMGASHFPAIPMPEGNVVPWHKLAYPIIEDMNSVELSYIAVGKPLPAKKKYEISVTITELDEDGEVIEDGGYDGDVSCELETSESPVSVVLNALRSIPGTSGYCT